MLSFLTITIKMAASNLFQKKAVWKKLMALAKMFLSHVSMALVYPSSEKAYPHMTNNCIWYIIQLIKLITLLSSIGGFLQVFADLNNISIAKTYAIIANFLLLCCFQWHSCSLPHIPNI